MPGLGTVINFAAILLAGFIGRCFAQGLSRRFQAIITIACGLSVVFMSVGDVLSHMIEFDGSSFHAKGMFTIILSMVLGSITGEMINIDRSLASFGKYLKKKSGNSKEAGFVNGFVTASLTVCIGAMAIIGSIRDGLYADHSILIAKSILDFVIIAVMTSSMGIGCMFSAIPVAIFQGTFTVLGFFIEPLLTEQAVNNISLVGSILIFCVGANLILLETESKFRFSVANMLPAIVFAVICSYIPYVS